MTLAALLLDLGDTLVRGDRVIEHVPEALDALSALHVGDRTLPLALVSDYTMAPGDPAAVARLVAEYTALLAGYGLARFFEPTAQHVTLSTEVGVTKPDPAMFLTALSRLGLPAQLATAMFITENADHVAAARQLGITAWQFGVDATDWSQLPVVVGQAIGDRDPARLHAAYALRLRVLFKERLARIERVDPAGGRTLAVLDGDPPRPVVLELGPSGDIVGLQHTGDTPGSRSFQAALDDNAAIARPGEPLAPGQTHALEPGPDGKPRRKRFSIS